MSDDRLSEVFSSITRKRGKSLDTSDERLSEVFSSKTQKRGKSHLMIGYQRYSLAKPGREVSHV